MSDKTTLQILIEARKLIEREEDWGQGNRGANNLWSGKTRFCALTACTRVVVLSNTPTDSKAVKALGHSMNQHIIDFNDTHTHPEVIAAFDRAIEAERAKVQP